MKTLPLVIANLKEFIRNWKSVLLLIVFPMILITLIFLSFNPDGLRNIPIGVIQNSDYFDMKEYESTYFSFLDIRYYNSVPSCMSDLKISRTYVCVNISFDTGTRLTVYYDNTQEPVIWEIIERIKSTIDILQKQKSKEIAGNFLTEFRSTLERIKVFDENLRATNDDIDNYLTEIDNTIDEQDMTKNHLTQKLDKIDSDIDELKRTRDELDELREEYYGASKTIFREFDGYADDFYNLSYRNYKNLAKMKEIEYDLEISIDNFNQDMKRKFYEFDLKVNEYELAKQQEEDYISDIDESINKLKDTKTKLYGYRDKITESEEEIKKIETKFSSIQYMTPDEIVNPIHLTNYPAYIPDVGKEFVNNNNDEENNKIEKINLGLSLISLQTLFPTILFLISLFLSLLISSFITLQNINSPANKRLKLIKGLFIPELVSTYISTLIILITPILCILIAGHYLFQLNIIENIITVSAIMFLSMSCFILFGMILAYLIRKKSTTLLVCTFLLVFLMFLSGFLLPVERMSSIPSAIAEIIPSRVSHSAFNKLVFYDMSFYSVSDDMLLLGVWLVILSTALITTKIIRKN